MNERTLDIKTICRDCIFAEFTEDAITQTGCKLGKLDIYRDKDKAKAIEDENGLEYYEISTFCNTCRDKTWDDKFSDPIERVIKEVEIKIDGIIVEDTKNKDWEKDVFTSVNSLLAQTIRPCRIVIVCYRKTQSFTKLKDFLDKAEIKYDIVNVLEYAGNINELINHGVKKCRNQFYTIVESGSELPSDFFEKLNTIVNVDLDQFSMIEPRKQLTGLTIQRKLHHIIQNLVGKDFNIVEVVKKLASEQNLPHMVRQL